MRQGGRHFRPHVPMTRVDTPCGTAPTMREDACVSCCVGMCVNATSFFFYHHRHAGPVYAHNVFAHSLLPHTASAMGQFLVLSENGQGQRERQYTVVVNMLTLEVVVQNIETAGESAGQTTAHEMLLARAGWKRNCCCGGAVQHGEFRAVSGYINGYREGYKAVTAPGCDGPIPCLWATCHERTHRRLGRFHEVHEGQKKTRRRLTFQRKRGRRPWNWPQSLQPTVRTLS